MSKAFFKNSKPDFEKRVYVLLGHRKIASLIFAFARAWLYVVCTWLTLLLRSFKCDCGKKLAFVIRYTFKVTIIGGY